MTSPYRDDYHIKFFDIIAAFTPAATSALPRTKEDVIREKEENKKAQQTSAREFRSSDIARLQWETVLIKEEKALEELQQRLRIQQEKYHDTLLKYDSAARKHEEICRQRREQEDKEKFLNQEIVMFEAHEKAQREAAEQAKREAHQAAKRAERDAREILIQEAHERRIQERLVKAVDTTPTKN